MGSSTGQSRQGTTGSEDVFSVSRDPLMGVGFTAMTTMWLMPWRAVAVVASEAMKDSMRGMPGWR